MAAVVEGAEISLTDCAAWIGERYQKTLDLLLTKRLEGRRDSRNRWLVSVASVERFVADQRSATGSGGVPTTPTPGGPFA